MGRSPEVSPTTTLTVSCLHLRMNKLLLLAFLVSLLALAAAGSQQQEEDSALDRTAREGTNQLHKKRKKLNKIERPKKGRKPKGTNSKPKIPKYKKKQPRQNSGVRLSCRTDSTNYTCLDNAMNYLKIMKDNVGNYMKQEARVRRANKTGGSKSGKKGVFGPVLHQILSAGGGNKSALACNGNTNSSGAVQLKNLTTILLMCENQINASCNPANFPLPNNTEVMGCLDSMTSFKSLVDGCMNSSGSEACTCWTDSNFTTLATAVRSCKLSDSAKTVIKQLSYCKGNFSACKKYEDDSVKAISACSTSTEKLLVKAKALTASVSSLTSAKATASSLAGNSSRRVLRAAATTCAEVITKITTMLTYVDEDPSSSLIVTISSEITSSSVTCTTAEKTSLSSQVTSIDSAITSVSSQLSTIQDNLQTVSGSTASSSDIAGETTVGSTATAASSGRRNIVARHLLNRLNLH